MIAYCVFCRTQRCSVVAELAERQFGYTALRPRICQRKWVRGVPLCVEHDLLPGYVFLYTETPVKSFVPLRQTQGVLRVLGSPDTGYILHGRDLLFAELIHHSGGLIGLQPLRWRDGRAELAGAAFAGMDAKIVKLDRQRMRAKVRYVFDGEEREMWVGVEEEKENHALSETDTTGGLET